MSDIMSTYKQENKGKTLITIKHLKRVHTDKLKEYEEYKPTKKLVRKKKVSP